MPNIFYINSQGEKISFDGMNYVFGNLQDMMEYSWNYNLNEYTNRVGYFSKGPVTKDISITALGNSHEDLNYSLERMDRVFEADIATKQQGKLFIEEFYLPCYIVACSSALRSNDGTLAKRNYTILSEDGTWIRSVLYRLYDDEEYTGILEKVLKKNVDYTVVVEQGDIEVNNKSIIPANYKLFMKNLSFAKDSIQEIYRFYEDGNNQSYLEAGFDFVFEKFGDDRNEFIVVDSENKTSTYIELDDDGNITYDENIFMKRDTSLDYIYEPLNSGKNRVVYAFVENEEILAGYGYAIIVYEKHSVPKGGVQCL